MAALSVTKSAKGKTPRKRKLPIQADPVEVYCRIRPIEGDNQICLQALNDTRIQLTPTESYIAAKPSHNIKELQYDFQYVFDEVASQKTVFDSVALPLVDDLVKGKNGLLFTYGITSSGKTYTMSGQPNDQGILPRSFDVIFNSIAGKQAQKYVFKPDRENGFEIQTEADAMLERQKRDILPGITTPKTPAKNRGDMPDFEDRHRVCDTTTIDNLEEDNAYSVFVSLIEIYNNSIYDLLEDIPLNADLGMKAPVSKNIREDANHNRYIQNVCEVEVTSPLEAFHLLYRGQKRRRVAHTTLNAESSRSHSITNIRVVQAPLDSMGKEVLQDPGRICVSQLSLVDLAGSERCKRTQNTGDRLKEAGNINQDLMALRHCIENLRENQKLLSNKVVSYRNTRLTLLFKNFFDGEGKVKMIVCVNPRADDYEETCQVLKFAELAQEIMIARPQLVRFDVGLTPGRRKLYKDHIKNLPDGEIVDPPGPEYNLGPPPPTYILVDPQNDTILKTLKEYLQQRLQIRSVLLADCTATQERFRAMLVDAEAELHRLRDRVPELENRVRTVESSELRTKRRNQELQRKIDEQTKDIQWRNVEYKDLENQLEECRIQLEKEKLHRGHMRADFKLKLQQTTEQHNKDLDDERRRIEAEVDSEQEARDRELRNLQPSIPPDETPRRGHVNAMKRTYMTPRVITPAKSDSDVSQIGVSRQLRSRIPNRPTTSSTLKQSARKEPNTRVKPAPPTKPKPAYNPKHRRSKSHDTWIDHRPTNVIPLDGIVQPQMRKKRSVTRLTTKDTKDASKYCLTHQQMDTDGELETRFIKGDMITTAAGGTAVVFNDVEVVKQVSPGDRKRKVSYEDPEDYSGEWTDPEDRCKYAIEHHGTLKRIKPTEV